MKNMKKTIYQTVLVLLVLLLGLMLMLGWAREVLKAPDNRQLEKAASHRGIRLNAQSSEKVEVGRDRNTSRIRLESIQRITPFKDYSNSVWSNSDPHLLAFTSSGGTFAFSLTEKKIRKLTSEVAGFKFVWVDNGGAIVYRERIDEQLMAIKKIDIETGKVSILAQSGDISLPHAAKDGMVSYRDANSIKTLNLSRTSGITAPSIGAQISFVYQLNDAIFFSENGITRQITKDEGKYFLPKLSPDSSKILYQEISRGLYITDLVTAKTTRIGRGDDAVWAPDSNHVIFEITVDNGNSVISSELYISDLSGQKTQLTNSANLIEMRPAWSLDRKFISFDANGAVYIGEIIYEQ